MKILWQWHLDELFNRLKYYLLSLIIIIIFVINNILDFINILMLPIPNKILTLSLIDYYLDIIFGCLGISFILSLPILFYHIYVFIRPGLYQYEDIKLISKIWIILGPWLYYIILQEAMEVMISFIPDDDIIIAPSISFLINNIIIIYLISNIIIIIPYLIKNIDIKNMKKIWFILIVLMSILGPPDILYLLTIIFLISLNFINILLNKILPKK